MSDQADHGDPAQPHSSPPHPRKRSRAELDDAQKKQRACHSCRRAKLRCIIETEGQPCKRCKARSEECRFKIPLHDDKWQENTSDRLDALTTTMHYLVRSLETIATHLDLRLEPPPSISPPPLPRALRPPSRSPSPSIGPSSGTLSQTLPLPPQPFLDQQQRQPPFLLFPDPAEESTSTASHSRSSTSHKRPLLELQHSYSTQSGASELLAQAYANYSPPFPTATVPNTHLAPPPPPQAPSEPDVDESASSTFFGILDVQRSPVMDARTGGTKGDEGVGSSDPRIDVVKAGVVSPSDAEILVDYFHAHLAPHLFGFPLRLRAWPYLPAGPTTLTPLLLSAILLLTSARLAPFHTLHTHLLASSHLTPLLNAQPGLSFAAVQDPAKPVGEEPDLDLELGIGPEEIVALLIWATFGGSGRSDVIARTAFEWTRGYLKTFMLPSPPPVTFGEAFGLLPARRDLTFPNWLRLWLFGYLVDAQQSLHHERPSPTPPFDPHFFCDTLLVQPPPDLAPGDAELVAHARLCAILQRAQHFRASAAWAGASGDDKVRAHEGWNGELDRWWSGAPQALDPASGGFALGLGRWFGKCYLNLAASKEKELSADPIRWRFRTASVRAAFAMLNLVRGEPAASSLNVLLPFYVKMVTLSAIVLLEALPHSLFIMLPCTPEHAFELVDQVAASLATSPLPLGTAPHAAAVALRKQMVSAEKALANAPRRA